MIFGTGLAFVLASLIIAPSVPGQDTKEQFLEASRKGNLETVKRLLDQGVDVNSKTQYGATALSYAADRGHLEIVKLLIDRGAEVNIRDTFYQETALGWAAYKGNADIVKLLIQKGATGKDQALATAVVRGHAAAVKAIIETGPPAQKSLTNGLAAALRAGRNDIAEILKAAGAVPPSKADFKVDPETLKNYEGTYRADRVPELQVVLKDGKLVMIPAGQGQLTLGAFDNVTFTVMEVDGIEIKFQQQEGKVTGLTVTQGVRSITYKKIENKQTDKN